VPNNPPSLESLAGIIRRLEDQVATLAARTPRGEAQQSLYDALPKGRVGARLTLTANSSALGAGATDMTITRPVLAGRSYRLHCISGGFTNSAAADWIAELRAAGTVLGEMYRRVTLGSSATREPFSGVAQYDAASDGDVVFDVAMELVAGSGTVTYTRVTTAPSQLWLEDMGRTPT
jgi:hypothetical protein